LESIDFIGKAITVMSTDPNEWGVVAATVIDANGLDDTVTFDSGEDANSILMGITITGGVDQGVYCDGTDPVISNCIVEENYYGITCVNSASPAIRYCKIRGHDSSSPAGHGIDTTSSSPTIENCWIYDNYYLAVVLSGGAALLENNTIIDSVGGIWADSGATPTIRNCIVWNSSLEDIWGCSATYSCIEGGAAGEGNIASYPYFADYANDDFRLTRNSPCINRGDLNVDYSGKTDIDGESRVVDGRVDIGAAEFSMQADNLVQNPGFELGGGGGKRVGGEIVEDENVPLNWIDYWHYATSSKEIDSDSHSVDYSWKFTGDGASWCGAYSDYMSVDDRKVYKLSAWLKSSDGNGKASLGWEENGSTSSFVLYGSTIPSEWTKFEARRSPKYSQARLRFFAPSKGTSGTIWWDDFSLTEERPVLHPYGWVNESDMVKSIDFGVSSDQTPSQHGGITWSSTGISDRLTDPNDSNIAYREVLGNKSLTIEIPAFNVDPNGFPLTPMLLEIMYKDTVGDEDTRTTHSYDLVRVYSKIDYLELDPDYLIGTDRNYGIANMGGSNNNEWKYIQYGFQKSDFQLLRAIDGKFTIKIDNQTDYSSPSYSIPIDYVSLKKITQAEYEALTDKQREVAGFYEVDLPWDAPADPCYSDPCLVTFVRDTMRPVYRHTKPKTNEVGQDIVGFSCWGEVEPVSFSIYSELGIENLTVAVSDLVHSESNESIDGNDVSIYKVVYDESRFTYTGRGPYGLIPDRLEEFASFSIDPNTSQRIWLKVDVPKESEGLSGGLYEGSVSIKKDGGTQKTVNIKFTVYDVTLEQSETIHYVYHGPFIRPNGGLKVFSEDLDEIFRAYRETDFDAYIGSTTHQIDAYDDGEGGVAFDTDLFEVAFQRAIDEGFIKSRAAVVIPSALYKDVYQCATGVVLDTGDTCLWSDLSNEDFVDAFVSLIETYEEIADGKNVTFIYHVSDEPGVNPYKRILVDRLYTIIHDVNGLTSSTYYDNCDYVLPLTEENNPNGYIVPDANIPPLTNLVDYKIWSPGSEDEGYYKHNNEPNYYGEFGYYTTGHSHYRNPVYNRFLHGLFAFRTGSTVIGAYAMGDLVNDPFNDFDSSWSEVYPFTYPDFIYAYPTWKGKLLSTMGGLEGIREGIRDSKYVTTLKKLIAANPNAAITPFAQDYLDDVKSRIETDYYKYYDSDDATELGYYPAILKDISEDNDADDFEAFNEIRKKIADYIWWLHSDPNNYTVHDTTQDIWYSSIQDAIDNASYGDVIKLYPRTYSESIDFKGKGITLKSTNPDDWDIVGATIIDADGLATAVAFSSGEDANSILTGFTITDANNYGVYCSGTSLAISNCIIKGNDTGVYCHNSSPTLSSCVIEDNQAYGVHLASSSPAIENNKIRENGSYGIYISDSSSSPTIKSNWICDNSSYGVRSHCTSAELMYNTIANNSGKGVYVGSGSLTVSGCVIWDNEDDLDGCSATYSCISDCNNVGDANSTHNICDNPLFVDPNDGDYHLQVSSPCFNAGDPNYNAGDDETDIDGDPRVMRRRIDMGADEIRSVHNITQDSWYGYIQDAIDEANGGDEIVAYEDTYYENVDFDGMAITVRSTDPCDPCTVADTIIDAGGSGYPVRFDSGEGSSSVLTGFTVTKGGSYGIYCYSSPVISNCIIEENGSSGIYSYRSGDPTIRGNIIRDNGGRGIYAYLSSTSGTASPKIENNEIYDNSGYGIYVSATTPGSGEAWPTIENNKIYGNSSYGIYSTGSTSRLKPTIKNNWIYENGGTGIRTYNGEAQVLNNTIYGHTSYGIHHILSGGSTTVTNCIVWNNNNDLSGCSATYSCIENLDGGTGNIHTDPNFVDAANGEYCLTHGSGCIDSANGNVDPPTDMFGQVRIDDPNTPNTGIGNPNYVDMGACEYDPD